MVFLLEQEHIHVRRDSGAFDVSHMGEIEVIGKDAFFFHGFNFYK